MKCFNLSCRVSGHTHDGKIISILSSCVNLIKTHNGWLKHGNKAMHVLTKSYPATPIGFPGAERITEIIYVMGEQAMSKLLINLPLIKVCAPAQGYRFGGNK